MLESATPALDPNQIIDPPNPTAYARKPQSYPPCFNASAVRGMLSKTAETKPRPSAVCQDAAGSLSTGIKDAQRIRESRKMLPTKAPGSSAQSGFRSGALTRSASHTAAPMNGNASDR